jgi:hypothetical protein
LLLPDEPEPSLDPDAPLPEEPLLDPDEAPPEPKDKKSMSGTMAATTCASFFLFAFICFTPPPHHEYHPRVKTST